MKGLAGAVAVHGYTTAFWWAAGIFALGLLLATLILPGRTKPRARTLKTILARHAIANCHHVDSRNGAVAVGAQHGSPGLEEPVPTSGAGAAEGSSGPVSG